MNYVHINGHAYQVVAGEDGTFVHAPWQECRLCRLNPATRPPEIKAQDEIDEPEEGEDTWTES